MGSFSPSVTKHATVIMPTLARARHEPRHLSYSPIIGCSISLS